MVEVKSLIEACALLMLLTAAYINEERNLRRAAYVFCLQALLLSAIFFMLGLEEWPFIVWGLVALVTKVFLSPYFVLRAIKQTGVLVEEEPYLSGWVGNLLLAALIGMGFAVGSRLTSGWQVVPLSVSLALFGIGLHLMLTRKNALKQVLGILHFENGSHMTLAIMAKGVPETVEIGIATDAVFLVLVCALLAVDMKRIAGTLDTSKLSLLRY